MDFIATIMADQRSSSTSFTYNAFISYYVNEGTRRSIASDLWLSSNGKGIHTFIDDQEPFFISPELSADYCKVIQESPIAIIVLSEEYLESSCCLGELTYIVDNFQQNHNNRFIIIIPVSYNIDVSSVREQNGFFAQAFAMHEARFKDNKENMKKWKNALSHEANLSEVWHFDNLWKYF